MHQNLELQLPSGQCIKFHWWIPSNKRFGSNIIFKKTYRQSSPVHSYSKYSVATQLASQLCSWMYVFSHIQLYSRESGLSQLCVLFLNFFVNFWPIPLLLSLQQHPSLCVLSRQNWSPIKSVWTDFGRKFCQNWFPGLLLLPKSVQPGKFWQPKLVPLANFGPL